jgi:hypothetical protein
MGMARGENRAELAGGAPDIADRLDLEKSNFSANAWKVPSEMPASRP